MLHNASVNFLSLLEGSSISVSSYFFKSLTLFGRAHCTLLQDDSLHLTPRSCTDCKLSKRSHLPAARAKRAYIRCPLVLVLMSGQSIAAWTRRSDYSMMYGRAA